MTKQSGKPKEVIFTKRGSEPQLAFHKYYGKENYIPAVKANEKSTPYFVGRRWQDLWEAEGGAARYDDEVLALVVDAQERQIPLFFGPVAEQRIEFKSPETASRHIKKKSIEFGASDVGITEIIPTDLYQGCETRERYAIAIAIPMRYPEFKVTPSPAAGLEAVRSYHECGEVAIKLSQHIRSLGYTCEVDTPMGDGRFVQVPIAERAGLGALGRHGSLMHPTLGPNFRLIIVVTSIPMAVDSPREGGVAKLCDSCKACRRYCPADAIPEERSPEAGKDSFGNDRYVVDTGKCYPYMKVDYSCGACVAACIYQRKEWARDYDGTPIMEYPDVPMGKRLHDEPLPPFDGVPEEEKHFYPRVNRGQPKKYWPVNMNPDGTLKNKSK